MNAQPNSMFTHVRIRVIEEAREAPAIFEVVWAGDSHFVIGACYTEIGDLRRLKSTIMLTGYDSEGNALIKIPNRYASDWMSPESASQIIDAYEEDQRMLQAAR